MGLPPQAPHSSKKRYRRLLTMNKWYNWVNEVLSATGIAVGADVLETANAVLGLVLIVLNIIVLLISLAIKVIDWFKRAKTDGKITKEEINELVDIVQDGVEDLKDKIDKPKK